MTRDYLDFDLALTHEGTDGTAYAARVVASPVGEASAPFVLPFQATELAQFMVAVGPPREVSRRLVPVSARVGSVKDYGRRLGDALLSGPVREAFDRSLDAAGAQGKDLRLRLRLDAVPELDPVPWEYLYDGALERFLTLSQQTPVVRLLDSLRRPPAVAVTAPLRVLVMISSPSDLPALAVDRERQLLLATTADMVKSGQLDVTVLDTATLTELQRALLAKFHVFHFIGHGGFDDTAQEGVLALERDDGTSHLVSGARLGTLLHDAPDLQLAVLNACEGARTSGRDAFSGVGQALVRQGLPAVVAMQTEISDRAALVFSHEFYWFLTRGLGIDASMCEVRKAMAVSDEASEWGTAVLLRSGSDQPFTFTGTSPTRAAPQGRLDSLYDAARTAIATGSPQTAHPLLEQITAEQPDYRDAAVLLDRLAPQGGPTTTTTESSTVEPPTTEPMTTEPMTTEPMTTGTTGTTGPVTTPPPPTEDRRSEPGSGADPARPHRALLVAGIVAALAVGVGGYAWWSSRPSAVATACGTATTTTAVANVSFTLGCATTAPEIDGELADWSGVPVHPITTQVAPGTPRPGPADLAGRWQGQWDSSHLYLHISVDDPARRDVVATDPTRFWMGDGVNFEFGPDVSRLAPATRPRSGKDFHVMVGVTPLGGLTSFNMANAGAIRPGRALTDVLLSRTDRAGGYEVEMAVPWKDVGVTTAPVRGSAWGLNVNISDAANTKVWAFGRMVSSNPVRTGQNQSLPATWQRLVLADSPGG